VVSKKALIILNKLIKVNPARLYQFFKVREVVNDGVVFGPIAIRLDGVNFSKALENFRKPRDLRVHKALLEAGRALAERFNALIIYVASDEINLILKDVPYGGRVFKLTSVSASIASAHTSLSLGIPLYFDSRIIKLNNIGEAVTYIIYRGRICSNNYISQLYHKIVGDQEVTPPAEDMLNTVINAGILSKSYDWELLGSCIHWGLRLKYGINPITNRKKLVLRRKLIVKNTIVDCISNLVNTYS